MREKIISSDYSIETYLENFEELYKQNILHPALKKVFFSVEEDEFFSLIKNNKDIIQFLNEIGANLEDYIVYINLLQDVVNIFGLENMKKLEKELGFFTHKVPNSSVEFETLDMFISYINMKSSSELEVLKRLFANGNLDYDKFLDEFANLLDYMRKTNVFTDYTDYDWIQGDFRDKYPDIFMDINAPQNLKRAFYINSIYPKFLHNHPEYIPYLVNRNLSTTINDSIGLIRPGLTSETGQIVPQITDFIEEYTSRYGNEKFLKLISKYGVYLTNITISSFRNEIENEQEIEKAMRAAIYKKIKNDTIRDYNYSELFSIPEFAKEYPEIFVNFDKLTGISNEEKQSLSNLFYRGKITFEEIRKYPQLANLFKDKDLNFIFKEHKRYRPGDNPTASHKDTELIEIVGKERFLELCSKYGKYLEGTYNILKNSIYKEDDIYYNNKTKEKITSEELTKIIEEIIYKRFLNGEFNYTKEDAPNIIVENHKELFLNDDAPEELKKYFYNYGGNYPMNFELLHEHKDWMTYLNGKSIKTALLKNVFLRRGLHGYFKLFGEEKAIKLGISRAETVTEMINSNNVIKMKSWYDKTGGKFIPDFVVMQNFSLEEADKFLTSGSNWSKLMKIKNFAQTSEARDAMLKLAYSFGAFDQDQRGFKKLQDLLTNLPKKISQEQGYIFDRIDRQIDLYSQRKTFFQNKGIIDENGNYRIDSQKMTTEEKEAAYDKMIEYTEENFFIDLLDTDTLVNLLKSLKKEKVDIDFSKQIFSQLYRKNDDGSYTLTINEQGCPKSAQAIRGILEIFREIPLLTPDKAHQLFGGFELKYDADFREFLLANMEKILSNPEYNSYVSNIQKQFFDIKAINSNRSLTWELAVSYVQTNKYTSVNVGNERVAEISGIAGYSQADFNTLQKIYNYGKQRTFSSIPRIEHSTEKTSGKYTYETLRLDDPLAMAIGTLTDCCQELNNCAEVCMEHSMVDKNGRVFVIKDEQGNIVAQSWVWRNKDVLCFDNIEIPDKAFTRTVKEHPELGRKGFTDEVFEIYKQAAHDLIEADEKIYRELLESNKITQEQYNGLKLGKITVGLGYNDIAESLKQKSVVDKGTISRPLPFEEPVKLSRGLYTNDSTTQYVLEEREDRKEFNGETLSVHNDTYIEYNDSNFTQKNLLALEKLEIVTKKDPQNLETEVSEYADQEHLVTEISKNYGLNSRTTKVVMNPNFAIIYDENDGKIRMGDLLFNTKVDNEEQQMDIENQVVMQIRLALEQISGNKEIDISLLEEKPLEMYKKVINLTNEIDIERGVGHAR